MSTCLSRGLLSCLPCCSISQYEPILEEKLSYGALAKLNHSDSHKNGYATNLGKMQAVPSHSEEAPDVGLGHQDHPGDAERTADRIVEQLLTGQHAAVALAEKDFRKTCRTKSWGWGESVARYVLNRLEDSIRSDGVFVGLMKDAYEKAKEAALAAFDSARDHPVLVTVIALGILCLVAPWLLELLGFARGGVTLGSWAARWQSTYKGFVPRKSLFAYLQSLGAKFGPPYS